MLSCISFDSYIKPQHFFLMNIITQSCISFDSYIKPQLFFSNTPRFLVVYLLIPTSNHNCVSAISASVFVVYLLIPTSNHNRKMPYTSNRVLYIF